jgi:hypothetical protein
LKQSLLHATSFRPLASLFRLNKCKATVGDPHIHSSNLVAVLCINAAPVQMRETHLYPCVCVWRARSASLFNVLLPGACCLGLLSVSAGAGVAVPGRDPVHGVLGHWHCATTKICERQDLLPCACAAEPCWGAGRGLPQLQERRRCCRGSSHCCCLTWGLWLFKLLSPSDQQKEKTHQPTGGLQWPVKVRAQWSEWTVTSLVCFLLIFFYRATHLGERKVKWLRLQRRWWCCVRWKCIERWKGRGFWHDEKRGQARSWWIKMWGGQHLNCWAFLCKDRRRETASQCSLVCHQGRTMPKAGGDRWDDQNKDGEGLEGPE